MAYRFASTHEIRFAIGPLGSATFGAVTLAMFLKKNDTDTGNIYLPTITNAAVSAINWHHRFDSGNRPALADTAGISQGPSASISGTTIWYLLVITRAAGSGTARFHIHDGTSWTHTNGTTNTLTSQAIGATDRLYVPVPASFGGIGQACDLVCIGIKKADSTDLTVETLTRTAFTSWTGFGFHWLVGFDASGTRTNLVSPGSGDEVSRTGTSLVADPAGWSFATSVTPVADFTGTPTSGAEPLSVTFTDASTNTPTSWAWTFGDGGTSTAQNPTHSYTTAGTYTVALVATNSAGSNTKTRTGYVTVSDQPRPIRINTSQGWADIGDATSFVSGTGTPTAAVGATGAVYLNTATGLLYGPKAGGAWPGSPITVPASAVAAGVELAYAEITAGAAITATSAATANTIVTAPAAVFDGSTRALVEFYAPGASPGSSDMFLTLWQDSAQAGVIAYLSFAGYGPVYGRRLFTPAAGSRVYSVRGYVTAGTTAAVAAGGGGGSNMPAYIRVSRA